MSNGLYSQKTPKTYTLYQFLTTAERLYHRDPSDFQAFMLTGATRSLTTQAYIDIQPDLLPVSHELHSQRDYDSLIGITYNIAVQNDIFFCPIPNPADVLRTSIHLSHPFKRDGVFTPVPYHRIPNCHIASWGTRSQIHILFPRLYTFREGSSVQLSEEQKMDLYDKGVRPAIRHLLPESASDWPASYKSESFRIRRTTGHNAYGTKIVPQEFINEFVKLWREYLASNDVQWAKDFVFIHTIRGVVLKR
ncbi:hypothetical protein PQX77_018152 [Marasmius sp. AFHP31]|nr:hypothetical protein PQX77_018152 [Marasmius sp. AFHP31]